MLHLGGRWFQGPVRLARVLRLPLIRVALLETQCAADAETGQLEKGGGRKRRVSPIAGEARRGADQLF